MMEAYKISYQNVGKNTYLAIGLGDAAIESMVGTIISNQIDHFLEAFRMNINGEMVVRYNISSRQSLNTMIKGGRKLKVTEVVSLLEGYIKAAKEAEEYRLPLGGLVVDSEYIYVDPISFDPAFLYLPVKSDGEQGIKTFVTDLIMQGKIELTSGNFVQLLLQAVSSEPLSLNGLQQCLETVRETGGENPQGKSLKQSGQEPTQMKIPSIQPVPVPSSTPANQYEAVEAVKDVENLHILQEKSSPKEREKGQARFPLPKKDIIAARGRKEKTEEKKETKETDAETARKKFLLPQAVFMVMIAAGISFGFFQDADGAIAIKNIFAAAIVLGIAEVICYREAYVNNQKKKAKEDIKDKKDKKDGNRKKVSGNFKPGVPLPPGRKPAPEPQEAIKRTFSEDQIPPQKPSISVPSNLAQRSMGYEESLSQPHPVSKLVSSIQPLPPVQGIPPMPSDSAVQGIPSAQMPLPAASVSVDQGWDDGCAATELIDAFPYLEYYENGRQLTYPLVEASVLAGHLAKQVHLVIHNPKVGRVHAEFTNDNGQIYVTDLNSLNGTYINGSGQRLNSNVPYQLKDNDRIKLANCELTLHCPA